MLSHSMIRHPRMNVTGGERPSGRRTVKRSWIVFLAALLFAFPLVAVGTGGSARAESVKHVSFTVSSRVSGATAEWTIQFTTGFYVLLEGGTITLTAPTGTKFSANPDDYTVKSFVVSTLTGGGTNSVTLTVPVRITGSSSVDVVADNVTNPAGPTEASEFRVKTSEDDETTSPGEGIVFGTAVENVTVSTDTEVADATADWTFEFTATSGLPGGGTITLTGPEGADFSGAAAEYAVNGTAVASATDDETNTVTVTLPGDFTAVPTGGAVEVVAEGVANPPAGTYPGGAWSVATSEDPVQNSPGATITFDNEPATQVTDLNFQPATVEAGVSTEWVVTFRTSGRGAMRSDFGLETITVTAPEGTSFSSDPDDYEINEESGTVRQPESHIAVITVPEDIAASSKVRLHLSGVTNPDAGSYDAAQFTVSTSVDMIPKPASKDLRFVENVYEVALDINPARAGDTAVWTWTFPTANGLDAADTVSLTGAEGTIFSTDGLDYTVNGVAPVVVSGGGGADVTLGLPDAFPPVSPGNLVTVIARNTHNPPPGSYPPWKFSVTTSADAGLGYPDDDIELHTSVHDVQYSWNALVAGAEATWTVEFTTSADGALEEEDDMILLAAPVGTEFSTEADDYRVNGREPPHVEADVYDPEDPDFPPELIRLLIPLDDPYAIAFIVVPADIDSGERVTVTARGTKNPPAGAYPNADFRAATTRDMNAAASDGATFTAPSDVSVSGLRFSTDVPRPGVATEWEILFVTSPSGGLDPGDDITIEAPTGTRFSSDADDYEVNDDLTTGVASDGNEVIVTVPEPISGSEVVTVTANDTVNPPLGVYPASNFSVTTTADSVPAHPADGLAFHTPPIADPGPDRVAGVGMTVTLDGSASHDPDGNPVTYAWSFESRPPGSETVLSGADTAHPSFVPDETGTYAVLLVVNDGRSDSEDERVEITVKLAPTASFTYAPTSDLTTETNIQFTDASTTTSDTIAAWSWDFGDGTTSSAQNPEHQYKQPGVYHVYLRVTGEHTGQSAAAHEVVLVGTPNAPIEGASFPTAPGDETIDAGHIANIQLTKRGSGDPIVTVASFGGQPLGQDNAVFSAGSSFFDINLDSPEGVDAIEFTWTFGPGIDPADLILMWYDPEVEGWRVVRDQTVHASDGGGGTLEVHLDHTTSPRIDQLTGTIFGAGATGGITRITDELTHGPNPAASSATFYFPSSSEGTLYVYDASGRLVWSTPVNPGTTSRIWNLVSSAGEPLANGLYLYRLVDEDGTTSDIGKLVIVR